MPSYPLKHARSGSDSLTALTSPMQESTSPLQTVAILPRSHFHEISRAAGPKGQSRKYAPRVETLVDGARSAFTQDENALPYGE